MGWVALWYSRLGWALGYEVVVRLGWVGWGGLGWVGCAGIGEVWGGWGRVIGVGLVVIWVCRLGCSGLGSFGVR